MGAFSRSLGGSVLICALTCQSANGAKYESQGQAEASPLDYKRDPHLSSEGAKYGRQYLAAYFALSVLDLLFQMGQGRRCRLPLAIIFRAVGAFLNFKMQTKTLRVTSPA